MFDTKTVVVTAAASIVATKYVQTVTRKRALKKAYKTYQANYITFENDFGGITTCRIDFVDSMKSILDHMK
jgi:hypothetical protein